MIKEILEKSGYLVKTVTDGANALDECSQNEFDLITLDINMPTFSGYDFLTLLKRKSNPSIKIIYVTVDPEEEVDKKGVEGFVHKPFTEEQLLAEVKRVLGE